METACSMTLDDFQTISDRLAIVFDTIEAEFEAHPIVIGLALVGVVLERTGREGLDQLLHGVRQVRAETMSREKAEARAAKAERRRRQ